MINAIIAQDTQAGEEGSEKKPRPLRPIQLTEEQLDLLKYEADHDGNARAVHALYGDIIRFTEVGWLYWNGRYWERNHQEVKRLVVDTLRQREGVARIAGNERIAQACTANRSTTTGILYMLEPHANTDITYFDKEDDLFPAINGVIDLRTGKLLPHDPKYGFTWNATVAYKPDADYTEWVNILRENVGGSNEVVEALQIWTGYTLTGRTSDEKAVYLQGPPRSGKGLYKETVKGLLPDVVAQEKSFNSFTARKDEDTDNFDLASLRATRVVFASESNRYQSLNAARLKNMTGGDEISAALKGKDDFRFKPKFKICLLSNHEVNADVDDDAVWGRLIVVPFPTSHLDQEDFTLKAKFSTDAMREAVLLWAVEGAMKWYQRGRLFVPETLKTTKQTHRDKQNTVSMWVDECVEADKAAFTTSAEARHSYETWCKANGFNPKQGYSFTGALVKRGFTPDRQPAREFDPYSTAPQLKPVKRQRGYVGLKII